LIRVPSSGKVVSATPPAAGEEKASYTPTKPERSSSGEVPTLEENFAGKTEGGQPVTEREQQLAAARAQHSGQGTTYVKPRLSFILSGGQAPAPEENEAALAHEEKKPDASEEPQHEIKTVHE
jgi:hypothetical protein